MKLSIKTAICVRKPAATTTPLYARKAKVVRKTKWLLAGGLTALLVQIEPTSASDVTAYSHKSAALCADVETGRILYERDVDAPIFPASLTKMMTLYELFRALDKREVALSDSFFVSKHASIQEPSKLGLESGDTIPVDAAIRAITVLSANDAAVAIAENLGGTEKAFSARMTADAKAMGMYHSYFANASGLPDPAQRSTARDLYILARHLIATFPGYYHYFSLKSFRWRGRRFTTHNHLLGKVDGVDGIKTGFIRASGFHLVGSAERYGHRLIAVVMGEPTSQQRDEAVARLLSGEFFVFARMPRTTADNTPVSEP